jgi:hypothetical protein
VSSPRALPRHRYAAGLLALLAVLAQLWMVQLSQQHLVRQVVDALPWGEVCRADGPGMPDSGQPMGMGGMGCAVCAVAGTGLAPPPVLLAGVAAERVAGTAPWALPIAPAQQRVRGLRPQPQAPPPARA